MKKQMECHQSEFAFSGHTGEEFALKKPGTHSEIRVISMRYRITSYFVVASAERGLRQSNMAKMSNGCPACPWLDTRGGWKVILKMPMGGTFTMRPGLKTTTRLPKAGFQNYKPEIK